MNEDKESFNSESSDKIALDKNDSINGTFEEQGDIDDALYDYNPRNNSNNGDNNNQNNNNNNDNEMEIVFNEEEEDDIDLFDQPFNNEQEQEDNINENVEEKDEVDNAGKGQVTRCGKQTCFAQQFYLNQGLKKFGKRGQ